MTLAALPLFAAEGAEGVRRTTFEWGRIQSNADWILPVAVLVGIGVFVYWMYRRDAVELHPLVGWLLTALRTAAFLGLLVLYLQPQWRTERDVTRNSRALLLVDTSLSMGLTDSETAGAGARSRVQQVAAALAETDLLKQLRKVHDVAVFQFSENLNRDRAVSLDKLAAEPPAGQGHEPAANGHGGSSAVEGAAKAADHAVPSPPSSPVASEGQEAPADARASAVDWPKLLAPTGTETQLGSALRQLISDEGNTPVAGIVVFSDGQQNKGIAPEAAVEAARKAGIPVYAVGLGSDRKPANVRVSDIAAPARAYPGDRYVVTGYLQAQQMAGRVVEVQLLSREARSGGDGAEAGTGQVEGSQQVTLGADGEALPVKFELTPDQAGRRTLCFRVKAPEGDRNSADDFREADIEIVDRRNQVLLLAGGPMREYQFLRNQLYRDRSTTVDVLLQTAQPGISQESHELLDEFPSTREEMFKYDCVIAFDPDWQHLDAAQVELLETWVAEQGGGLIVVAGPVYSGKAIGGWLDDASMAPIRALYPVEFHRRFSVSEGSMYVGEEPWPLEFTREGLEAEYLWLADAASASRQAWAEFAGVFAYCPVRGPKPGASVLARFSDPRTGDGGRQPVFFAEQFYGSGRVFFIGSGEMWRLRKQDESYFEQFYTKLIRHVSQGRLLRGSTRGVLLVGQDRYLLGGTVEVRAQLTNPRLEPLQAPNVAMQVFQPDGTVQTVTLQPDASRAGTFAGQFPALREGTFRIELPVPESNDERLTRRIQVNIPDLERENPQRNDALLSRLAQGTGGRYYVGLDAALGLGGSGVVEQLKDRTRTVIIPDVPDRLWEQTWLQWMMLGLCGVLCLEWLIRRLLKLA